MSVFDDLQGKAQELIQGNEEAVKDGIEKVGDFIDDKTGGKFEDQMNALQDGASNLVEGLGGK